MNTIYILLQSFIALSVFLVLLGVAVLVIKGVNLTPKQIDNLEWSLTFLACVLIAFMIL